MLGEGRNDKVWVQKQVVSLGGGGVWVFVLSDRAADMISPNGVVILIELQILPVTEPPQGPK